MNVYTSVTENATYKLYFTPYTYKSF